MIFRAKDHCYSPLVLLNTIHTGQLKYFLGNHFKKKWANPGLFLFIFVLFSLQFKSYKLKKLRWSAWDLNLQLQDGRYRQNHGAMAIIGQCYCFMYNMGQKNSIDYLDVLTIYM